MWKHNFVNRFINCEQWRKKFGNIKDGKIIAKQKAVFTTPTHITVRQNEKGFLNVHGVLFSNRKLMGNKEVEL